MGLIIRWIASALALIVVTKVVPGVVVTGLTAALIAALAIGLVNATLGGLLKLLTLPIGCMTLGISSLIINALMFMLAAQLVSGFGVSGFIPALLGSILMTIVTSGIDMVLTKVLTSSDNSK